MKKLSPILTDWLKQLNFEGLGSKACIYKNFEWWNTPLHAHFYPFDWNMFDIFKKTGPMYNTDPYNCEKGYLGFCSGALDCSVGGLCIKGDNFWSLAQLDVKIRGRETVNATEAKERFADALGASIDRYLAIAKKGKKRFKFYPWLGKAIAM